MTATNAPKTSNALGAKRCVPCEGGTTPLSKDEALVLHAQLDPRWKLIDEGRKKGGNAWELQFIRMFDQTNAAELFRAADALQADGFRLDGNRWVRRKEVCLPVYEAKMIQAYDHRAAGVIVTPYSRARKTAAAP